MWLTRQVDYFLCSGRLVAIRAPKEFGSLRVAQALAAIEPPTILIELPSDHSLDEVALGNLFSDAVNRCLEAHLLGYGLALSANLALFEQYLDILGPFRLIVTGCEYSNSLSRQLHSFVVRRNACDLTLLLFFTRDVPLFFGEVELIGPGQLQVKPSEMRSILQNSLSSNTLVMIGLQEGWAIELVERRIAELERIPLGPPDAAEYPETSVMNAGSPSEVFEALLKRGKWISAFELATSLLPEALSDCIDNAGELYFDSGQYSGFWRALSRLPPNIIRNDQILFWYFSAALALGKHQHLVGLVKEYLRNHEAPRLRGLLAASIPTEDSLSESRRACQKLEDCYTLKYYAYCLLTQRGDGEAIRVLRNALFLAEQEQKDSQVVDIGNKIGESHIRFGEYNNASIWADWALKQCYERKVGEELRKLEILGTVIFCGILCGRPNSVGAYVERIEGVESSKLVPSLVTLISTLGDFFYISGAFDRAIELYSRNARSNLGPIVAAYASRDLVRALLSVGDEKKAIEVASRALSLAKVGSKFERTLGLVSLGSAYTRTFPKKALPLLRAALDEIAQNKQATWAAQASIHLVKCHINLNQFDEARSILYSSNWALRELGTSGWRLFGGAEEQYRDVWLLFEEDALPVDLNFLGGRRVRIESQVESFPMRWCEILAILAMSPMGLSGEQLALKLYGDSGNVATLKSTLSRLRKIVPIQSRPYRIGLPYSADFVELECALREGKLSEALEMYQGPLLELSQAPGIVEARVHLEEVLREAVLISDDSRSILQLARRLKDDLEVWERAFQLISKNDPQLPIVRAQVQRIRRDWGES